MIILHNQVYQFMLSCNSLSFYLFFFFFFSFFDTEKHWNSSILLKIFRVLIFIDNFIMIQAWEFQKFLSKNMLVFLRRTSNFCNSPILEYFYIYRKKNRSLLFYKSIGMQKILRLIPYWIILQPSERYWHQDVTATPKRRDSVTLCG